MSEKRERICPVCGRSYTDPPALSRRDNYATGNKWAIENFEATHS